MKKISLSLVAMTVVLLMAPAAQAKTTPGWYGALGVGVAFPEDPTMFAGGSKREGSMDNTNLSSSKSAGYAFDNGIRLAAEFYYNQMNVKMFNNVHGFGHILNRTLFANAYYDFNNKSFLTPYVGAGFGVDFVNVNNVGNAAGRLNGEEVAAAYQGIVGVAAQIDENWAITADYRYVASFDPDAHYTGGTSGHISNASQNIMIGVRYSFGAEEPAVHTVEAPAIVPHKVVKAPVAEVGQNFMVFFDFDRDVLTPEAKKIIAAAAKEFQKDGFAKIVVTGHTDTMGTETYNLKLSVRRAAAVKAELAKLGVSEANVKDTGVGKNDLLVPTTDGVREAQNRRAEIVLSK